MDILGQRLMASQIELTIENPEEQTLTIKLMFPTDFGNNIFDVRYLKFHKVTFYKLEEIILPLGRPSQITQINDLGIETQNILLPADNIEYEINRKRFEILTTVGKRTINFSSYEFTEN